MTTSLSPSLPLAEQSVAQTPSAAQKKRKSLARRAVRTLAILVAAFAATLFMLAWFQEDRILYQPANYPQDNWDVKRFRVPAEDVAFHSADGTRLHGWWIPPADPKDWVFLWSHGNGGNMTHRAYGADKLRDRGWGVFMFDYRGYGKSEKRDPSEAAFYADADAAWDVLVKEKGVAPEQIILFGESLGAAVAVEMAMRHPEAPGLVLQTPFASVPAMAQAILGFPVGPMLKNRYDNLSKIAKINRPLHIVHGDCDDVVPFNQGRQLFDAAKEPKEFLCIPGGRHNDLWDVDWKGIVDGIEAFLDRLPRKAD
jgi:alpha-beta hydrolase superfamily lysophospholipase